MKLSEQQWHHDQEKRVLTVRPSMDQLKQDFTECIEQSVVVRRSQNFVDSVQELLQQHQDRVTEIEIDCTQCTQLNEEMFRPLLYLFRNSSVKIVISHLTQRAREKLEQLKLHRVFTIRD